MQRFMETNQITYNLMSFSGFKGLLIFSYLLEAPRSYEEIVEYLSNHPYVKETVHKDTIRIYINTLKRLGCDIKILPKSTDKIKRYYIDRHPFELKITDEQTESILKIFKAISKSIDLEDFMALQSFFEKIELYISNEYLKERIRNISPIKMIDKTLLRELIYHTKQKDEIIIEYDSPNSGIKNINILADKLYISNEKLYLAGINSEYESYGSLLVNKMTKVIGINSQKSILDIPTITIKYQYSKIDNKSFEPTEYEKIIKETKNTLIVEATSENKFYLTQRVLSLGDRCTILEPQEYRQEIISCLKQMKEGYFG